MRTETETIEGNAVHEEESTATMLLSVRGKRVAIRRLAIAHYKSKLEQLLCVFCGFGIEDVLEVAHLDNDRTNNDPTNWAFLCPTCHRMLDLGLIPRKVIQQMRDNPQKVNWRLLQKDAGAKAAESRRKATLQQKRKIAAKKAVETRLKNAAEMRASSR